jgi:hypothetical protein
MAEADKKPGRPGKLRYRKEKNPGVDARDQRDPNHGETPQKPAPGLREIRGIGRDSTLCHSESPHDESVEHED